MLLWPDKPTAPSLPFTSFHCSLVTASHSFARLGEPPIICRGLRRLYFLSGPNSSCCRLPNDVSPMAPRDKRQLPSSLKCARLQGLQEGDPRFPVLTPAPSPPSCGLSSPAPQCPAVPWLTATARPDTAGAEQGQGPMGVGRMNGGVKRYGFGTQKPSPALWVPMRPPWL